MYNQNIACPNCNSNIPFDVNALLQGVSFTCSSCNAKIELSNKSKGLVEKSINEFNKLKANALKQ